MAVRVLYQLIDYRLVNPAHLSEIMPAYGKIVSVRDETGMHISGIVTEDDFKKMESSVSLNKLVRIISIHTGVCVKKICSRTQTRKSVEARYLLYAIAMRNKHTDLYELGNFTGHNRNTVRYGIQLIDTEPKLKQTALDIEKKFLLQNQES
jgi:chromosomal replication initiation ATPase DnaA